MDPVYDTNSTSDFDPTEIASIQLWSMGTLKRPTFRQPRPHRQGMKLDPETLRQSLLDSSLLDEDTAQGILSELPGTDSGEESSDQEDYDNIVLDIPTVKKATLSPALSVTSAQQRLKDEEAAFKRRKTEKKSGKIQAASTAQMKIEQKAKDKQEKKALKEQGPKKSFLDNFKRDKGKKSSEPEPEQKNRIDISQANKKADDQLKKTIGTPITVLGLASKAEKGLAKGTGEALSAANTGDDIASAAGAVAASSAGVAQSLLQAYREFRLYSKTEDAEADVHLSKAFDALGGAAGNLVNLTSGSLKVAEHSGAFEAGSAVPILGIVAAVPTLLAEINQLRSAMNRLRKQRKIHKKLKTDPTQLALDSTLTSFMSNDKEAIGKGITKIILDFTKIAGHGTTLGGVTAPVGVALIGVAAAGKLLLSGIGTIEDFSTAHKANDRRKKLNTNNTNDPEEDEDEWHENALAEKDETPQQRNARKLIKTDPQVAAQIVLDQARREGEAGGPASKILRSFGIKEEQMHSKDEDDDEIANNREMRQKMLFKLQAEDETALTLTQKATQAKDGAKDYLSFRTKHKELANYMAAKDLLKHGGNEKRTKGWQIKMDILTDDVEEKKEALLAQVLYLKDKKDSNGNPELDPALAQKVELLLQPRKPKK